MIIFVNSKNEIKDVDITSDNTLTPHEINDIDNPFSGWSTAKICCYKATVLFGKVVMMTPYVDSRIIEHIDKLGKNNESNEQNITEVESGLIEAYESGIETQSQVDDLESGLIETFETTISNADSIDSIELAIEELYEMIINK